MRLGSVVSEAWRDVCTGTTRALLLSVLLTAVVGAVALADVAAVTDITARARAFRASGAAVQVLDATEGVDAVRCEALGTVEGVLAAGASRSAAQVTALALPSTPMTVHEVTPGLLTVFGHSAPTHTNSTTATPGVWLAADLAEALGTAPGDDLATETGPVPVAGVFTWPDDGRDRAFGYSLLSPVPATGTFDRCLSAIWPLDEALAALTFFAADTNADNTPRSGQLNSTQGNSFDTNALLAARPTAWAPLAAATAGLGIGYAAVRARRLEIAAALHACIPKAHLAWTHQLQVGIWSLAAALILTAVLTWTTQTHTNPGSWLTGLRIIVIGTTTPLLGSLLAATTTREKHLFRYFKER